MAKKKPNKSGLIIQARMGSTRLPGKMMMPFFEGKGIFEILVDRLTLAFPDLPVVLATTTHPNDDALVDIAEDYGLKVFRGSEENVLERFINAAKVFDIENVIRICADNPFLDTEAIRNQIENFESGEDYFGYSTNEGLPTIKTPYGFWTEAVSLTALQKVRELTDNPFYLEHVTNFIYGHPEHFKIRLEKINPKIESVSNLRLTLDTPVDFELQREIFHAVYGNAKHIRAVEVAEKVAENPEWLETMAGEILKNKK